MNERWIANRMQNIQVSGIRRVFDLAAKLKNPVNLSIGQPHFPIPDAIKKAAKDAIDANQNSYTQTQGIAALRNKLMADVDRRFTGLKDRNILLTSGTSGGLVLSLMCTINPGDEVIFFDPFFVMYPQFVMLAGGVPVVIDTYPDFKIDVNKVRDAITTKTKAIIVNTPGNPTGAVPTRESLRDLAKLAKEKDLVLISDEVYSAFSYDEPFTSPLEFNDETVVLDGFSKTYGMTGLRLGFCHGPNKLIDEMIKLQQFTYVCAPSIVQHAGVAALDVDMSAIVADYKAKRDRLCDALGDSYEITKPGGAFYIFPKVPGNRTGQAFVEDAIANNLLIIPGNTFSHRDTHFRISYAASDEMIDRGIEILRKLAK